MIKLSELESHSGGANIRSSYLSDILSAGLDSGVAVSIIVVYFALQYPKNGNVGINSIQAWWGNAVSLKTADFGAEGGGTPLLVMPDGKPFG